MAAAMATPTPAQAQDQTQASSPGLEEIVVHARKREEKAVQVPIAITAVTNQQMKEQSITQVEDVGRLAPNVSLHSFGGTGTSLQSVIRGQTSFVPNVFVDGAVGYYFDGVYIAQGTGLPAALYDLDSIEIARGVQGTLNGRNNTGGSIQFFSRQPVLNEYQGELSFTGGSLGTLGGSVMGNIPLGDTLALRLDYKRADEGAWGHSTVTGQDFGGYQQNGWRASLRWEPTDDFSAHIIYEGTHIDQNPTDQRMAPGSPAVAAAQAAGYTLAQLLPSNWYDNASSLTQPWITQSQSVRTNFEWDFADNMQAKLIAGYHYASFIGGLDVSGSPITVATTNFGDTSHQFSLEPQLLGHSFDDRLSWVVGYFYFIDTGDYFAAGSNYAKGLFGSCSPPVVNGLFCSQGQNISNAGYLHGDYKLTDDLHIAAGFRYTADVRKVDQVNYVPTLALFKPYNGLVLQKEFDYPSYEVSIHYDLTDQLHPYFRTGRGQRSGGFSAPITSPVAKQGFQPEVLTDYEIGLKADHLLDGKLNFNIDYFYGRYRNVQRFESALGVGSVYGDVVLNAAQATIQGIETDFNYHVLPSLTLSGYASWTDFSYDSFPFHAGNGTTVDLSGIPPYLTPKFMTRIGAAYDIPVSFGTFTLSGGWNWQSSEQLYLFPYPNMKQKPYSLFDLRLGWTSPDGNWEAAVYSTNLTDTHYATVGQVNGSPNPVTGSLTQGVTSSEYTLGEPRVVAVSLTYHFSAPVESPTAAPAAYTPPPVVAPAPAAAQSYLVFFDFDKSDLTPQAVAIVDQAAKNATPAKVTRLTVTGHTDTVGSDAYNMRLSRRRAESVAAELEKQGIPSDEIEIVAKGKRDLLVPTGDGVREPQNRRVQIVYGSGPTS
jgi:iron complex outermembrane receptor protein